MAISASLSRLASSLLALIRNRLELAAVEFEEDVLRVFSYLLRSLIALFFLGLALALVVVLVLALSWDTPYRYWVLCGMCLTFAVLGIRIGLVGKQEFEAKPALLSHTLDELNKDMASLRAASEADPK